MKVHKSHRQMRCGIRGQAKMTEGNISLETLRKLVNAAIRQNPAVFERLAEL
jgi:hypothetical protein